MSLHGRVQDLAAADLAASLDVVIGFHPETVVLDVTDVEFMGAAGVVAVGRAEKRFAEAGITLTVRSPSTLVSGLAGMIERSEVASLERALSAHGHLGREQTGHVPHPPPYPSGSITGARDLRRVTAIPTDPDVVDGALELVVELARTAVAGADGVSVSLLRHGVLSTVAASDQTVVEMDTDQYATGEGPCVDAARLGHWFHAESMDDETRWPLFTPTRRALGIKAILSSPLRAFQEPVGALNIYSLTASTFDVRAQETAAIYARKASVILSDAGAGVTDEQLALRFREALRCRDVIALARGIIMERDKVVDADAFTTLLHLSLDEGVTLLTSAEKVVRSAPTTRSGK